MTIWIPSLKNEFQFPEESYKSYKKEKEKKSKQTNEGKIPWRIEKRNRCDSRIIIKVHETLPAIYLCGQILLSAGWPGRISIARKKGEGWRGGRGTFHAFREILKAV